MTYYAKSKLPNGKQPTVKEHLDLVAYYAAQYGRPLEMEAEAEIAGQFHDFGKYSNAFADVLRKTSHNIDHAICGAALLYQMFQSKYSAVMEVINGHHNGLVEITRLIPYLKENLSKDNPMTSPCGKFSALSGRNEYGTAFLHFKQEYPGYLPPQIHSSLPQDSSNLISMLYTRMLFSCLVDADYSVSAYENDEDYFEKTENIHFNGKDWLEHLYEKRNSLRNTSTAASYLNQIRDQVFEECGNAGETCQEGLFTLTAPTGTGKTLALLHFALRHCIAANKKRIILVLPYLTLAEQNTEIYQEIIPDILVDHSQSDLDETAQEFAERWSAPFIITTSVKFFESLFSDKPAACRKLHNIANSVIVFDEAQSLPPEVTTTTLQAVDELCRRYHSTMVFSTATQPDFDTLHDVEWKPHEILPGNAELFEKLRRTEVVWRLKKETEFSELAGEIAAGESVCVIVNLRRHARTIFESLRSEYNCPKESLFFLTTDLCPAHRAEAVKNIKYRLKKGLPCRVVATQCIEAGVDLDFSVMYRALAPLDAIIQAAGRCNRNGDSSLGKVIVFKPADEKKYPSDWYGNAAEIVEVLNTQESIDIHNPEHIRKYYSELFREAKDKKSLKKAIDDRNYEDTAQEYRLIDNEGIRVLVPYAPCKNTYDELRSELLENGITPLLMKKSAPLTVSCYHPEKILAWAEPVKFRFHGRIGDTDSGFYILRPQYESYYKNEDMGLQFPEKEVDHGSFMV